MAVEDSRNQSESCISIEGQNLVKFKKYETLLDKIGFRLVKNPE